MEREFKGVWIPAEIWLRCDLSMVEKALFAEIDSFSGNGREFRKSNQTIEKEYGISRPTISKSLKKLVDLDLVEVRYDGRLRFITTQPGKNISGRRKESFGQKEKIFPSDGKNLTQKNTIERTRENTLKNKGVVLPFEDESFIEMWDEWILERRERKIKKYTPRGEQAALHKLQKESGGDSAIAVQMIQQSIANGWTGIFPLKTQKNDKPNRGASDGSLIEAHLRRLANDS